MAYENTLLRKQLNSIPFVGLKGIRVGDALAIDTWHFQEWTRESIANFEFVKIPEYECKIEGDRVDKAFVLSYAHSKREDWSYKFHTVERIFNNKAVITSQKGYGKRNPYLDLIPIWYFQLRKLKYSSVIKKGICIKICNALGQGQALLTMIKKMPYIKKVVVFCDIPGIDSVLIQLCNQRGYLTYTLQHGIINGTYDYVEYKCSQAKYFLAWGEYTKWMAMKYGMQESKIKVVGSMSQPEEKTVCEVSDAKRHDCFLVCTNGVDEKSAWSRNKELIQIANRISEKFGMKYYLKVHPYDDANRYRHFVNEGYCIKIVSKSMKISDALKEVDFTLCGNSTTFCDSIYYGIPAFRYIASKDAKIDVCKGIAFGRMKSYEELESELEKLKENRKLYQKKIEKVRKGLFNIDNVSEEYVQAIGGMLW